MAKKNDSEAKAFVREYQKVTRTVAGAVKQVCVTGGADKRSAMFIPADYFATIPGLPAAAIEALKSAKGEGSDCPELEKALKGFKLHTVGAWVGKKG